MIKKPPEVIRHGGGELLFLNAIGGNILRCCSLAIDGWLVSVVPIVEPVRGPNGRGIVSALRNIYDALLVIACRILEDEHPRLTLVV